jgi:hypothetical protein
MARDRRLTPERWCSQRPSPRVELDASQNALRWPARRIFVTRWASIFVLFCAAACAATVSVPRTGPHPAGTTQYIDVPYPPPPARVEVVPPKPPDPGAVWVDGEWGWQGKRWVWQPGGWVAPAPAAYFAPWIVYRLDNGRLLFAPGSWHAASGEKLPNPVVLEAARNGLDDEGSTARATPPPAPASSVSSP